jgi:hypothetical protein
MPAELPRTRRLKTDSTNSSHVQTDPAARRGANVLASLRVVENCLTILHPVQIAVSFAGLPMLDLSDHNEAQCLRFKSCTTGTGMAR